MLSEGLSSAAASRSQEPDLRPLPVHTCPHLSKCCTSMNAPTRLTSAGTSSPPACCTCAVACAAMSENNRASTTADRSSATQALPETFSLGPSVRATESCCNSAAVAAAFAACVKVQARRVSQSQSSGQTTGLVKQFPLLGQSTG
eukprot:358110-Chlamydomonas_euryale.AAC.1